ncbi:MAG: hypothetical protein P1V81_16140 [Planctomycetota bacterium]|nr:hypothetical protein [Planctomycetota bacterium]
MKLNATQARELAETFRKLAIQTSEYRAANWAKLKPSQRQDLADAFWSLLNASTDMETRAVGLVIEGSEAALKQLTKATNKARTTVKRIDNAQKAIAIVDKAIGLAGAIALGDASAIAKSAKGLYETATAS